METVSSSVAGNRVSTGIPGLDKAIDMLRLGDNVVWQVQSIQEYLHVINPYIRQSKKDGRRLVYFRFGSHEPLMQEASPLSEDGPSVIYKVDPSEGFERFTTKINHIIEEEGLKAFYVFDCLSDLLEFWYSDLMIGNFFRVTCPFLYQLDTIAYFALIRGVHTHSTIARIRETTQLLLDLYSSQPADASQSNNNEKKIYIHPLKVWERYSPTMFFPHLIEGDNAISITSSADAAALFSDFGRGGQPRDYWDIILDRAYAALEQGEPPSTDGSPPVGEQAQMKNLLTSLIVGISSEDSRMTELSGKYFTLRDILDIASREIGTGFIGGKSVGMLLGRKILEKDGPPAEGAQNHWEPHDSFFLGSDIFYTYIVQNGWWRLRTKQKTKEGYFTIAGELREKLLHGKFPEFIREHFYQMLEHYGQSPIIVRSSSLLEDNFGNAFAGKYESVFCANQGSPEERCEAFEQAVRTVYASTMSDDALAYRQSRGLTDRDEQMAILVQRVSGDHYGELFFPHIAGMGNSSNLYVWNKDMNPDAGMLRLVFGLGTRAVDRVSGDYARIVPLDHPTQIPPVNYGDEKKFSQHQADVLNLRENRLTETPLDSLLDCDLKTDKDIFFSVDSAALSRLRELDLPVNAGNTPKILDFKRLLTETAFPAFVSSVLSTLKAAYQYPVDIEFTVNFNNKPAAGKDAPPGSLFRFNLLQCRPLQTKGLGKAVEIPAPKPEDVFFAGEGNFMGGNIRLPLDYVVFIHAQQYLDLSEQEKYHVARTVGMINQKLKGSSILLIGPGRWGTTTPSLGVPVHFSEIGNMAAVCEVSYCQGGLMPELSFGSHFFQDIVESGIFYAAIFDGEKGVTFQGARVTSKENILGEILPEESVLQNVIQIVKASGLTLYSDIISQRLLCC